VFRLTVVALHARRRHPTGKSGAGLDRRSTRVREFDPPHPTYGHSALFAKRSSSLRTSSYVNRSSSSAAVSTGLGANHSAGG
jgi:hypothetical protein